MKNKYGSGAQFLYTVAGSAITAGTVRVVGGMLGVATIAGAIGDKVPMDRVGQFSGLPKTTGAAWTAGDLLYWDATAGSFTKVATNNTLRGYADHDAASGAATGDVCLTGQVA